MFFVTLRLFKKNLHDFIFTVYQVFNWNSMLTEWTKASEYIKITCYDISFVTDKSYHKA